MYLDMIQDNPKSKKAKESNASPFKVLLEFMSMTMLTQVDHFRLRRSPKILHDLKNAKAVELMSAITHLKSLAKKARQQVKRSCAFYANASRLKSSIISQPFKSSTSSLTTSTAALASLSGDPGLHQLVSYLVPFVADKICTTETYQFTHCRLQSVHLVLALQLAMTTFSEAKSYATASTFAKRLLELNPAANVATQAKQVLSAGYQNPKDVIKIDHNQFSSLDICAGSDQRFNRCTF
ncbi:COPI alpha subunit C-terminus-domain-containing protein [Melampsora americana]|nr:COPI alpha subunit C-terminus-domain-containing protein [Melampsora americana]